MPAFEELTPSQQVAEIHDEFMIESANYKLERRAEQKAQVLNHINALLDAYLDMWPVLAYEPGVDYGKA